MFPYYEILPMSRDGKLADGNWKRDLCIYPVGNIIDPHSLSKIKFYLAV